MDEININEIVKVESLGVIKQQLDKVEQFVDEKIKDIPSTLEKIKQMSFLEQEDEKNDIKKYQQYLSKIQKELEDKRKEIKEEINKPYKEFEEYYKNGVYEKLDNSIKQIKDVVNEIETLQKDEKECELREFTNQYIVANNLQDIVNFENIPLNITLSASMKSLKEEVKRFIEDVANDVELIKLEEYSDEILDLYINNEFTNFDFAKSKLEVINRHKRLEELKTRQLEQEEIDKANKMIIEKVEEITAPKEIIDDNDLITVSFKVTGTKEQVKQIKNLIIELGVEYE